MYETPKITDYGSIAEHTFANDGSTGITVPGQGPDGKNQVFKHLIPDKFGEPSHS